MIESVSRSVVGAAAVAKGCKAYTAMGCKTQGSGDSDTEVDVDGITGYAT